MFQLLPVRHQKLNFIRLSFLSMMTIVTFQDADKPIVVKDEAESVFEVFLNVLNNLVL